DHVRVRHLRDRLRFAAQARLASSAQDLRPQELERDLAIELGVVGREDAAHPALAKRLEDQKSPHCLTARDPLDRSRREVGQLGGDSVAGEVAQKTLEARGLGGFTDRVLGGRGASLRWWAFHVALAAHVLSTR